MHFRERAAKINGVCINSPENGSPYIQHISLSGYISRHVMDFLSGRGIYVSTGSACGKGGKSRVLEAMKMPQDKAQGALRISFCRDNTIEDIDTFFESLTIAMNEIARR
jgi:cysteine desulfurase